MTDDEVDDYVRFLHARLPAAHAHLSVEQVRAVLDAEGEYFQRRFGPLHGWRALARSIFGRGEPAPQAVDAAIPEFEDYAASVLEGRDGLTRADVRAVMRVEGEAGPQWTPNKPLPSPPPHGEESAFGHEDNQAT